MRYLYIILCFFTADVSAQSNARFFDLADSFFQQYVDNGKVKYAEIKQNPKALNELLTELKAAEVSIENSTEYKAFWINAYNIAAINGIVQNYPLASPMEVNGFFDKMKHSIGQKSVTLDEIEHDLLFLNFPEEERLHFVLVCAAKGCPPITSQSYRPEFLEQQLQEQTEKAINDPDFIRVGKEKVLLSEIMKWYREDFIKDGKTLVQYVNQFRKNKIPEHLKVEFYVYDWELNE